MNVKIYLWGFIKMNVLSTNQMIDIYVGHGLKNSTVSMFGAMRDHGLINSDTLNRFSTTVKDWKFAPNDSNTIIDKDGNPIFVYTEYKGFKKV